MGAPAQHDLPTENTAFRARARVERYDREGNQAFYRAAMVRLLDGALSLTGRGLDLGCGTGISTEVLLEKVPRVDWQGVDCAQAMLNLARRKPSLAGVEFHHARAEELPLGDHSFDVVVANFAWHWFGEGAGAEVRRVLRPGGWLLASVPLRRFSRVAGNRALAAFLLSDRQAFTRLRSQGFRFEDVPALLPGPVRVARHELFCQTESFADGSQLLDVLDSRGALVAIFGERAPKTLQTPSPVDFEWPFAILHAQV
jgi:SAM-dependent methyltransferase